MPNTVARQVLVNGSRNYAVKLTIVGDGSGEETAALVNAVTGDMGTDNKLWSITGIATGCTAQLSWDATTDVFVMGIPQDKDVCQKFSKVGGLINNAGTGKTGDLVITTAGLGAGDTVELVVYVKKRG